MVSGRPLLTLAEGVANTITGVTDTAITRRSTNSKTDTDTEVSKAQILRVWHELASTGTAQGDHLKFAYALVGQLVEGVAFERDPFRLVLASEPPGIVDSTITHLLFKWNPDRNQATIERHREIAEARGRVWWGAFSEKGATVSLQRVAGIKAQIAAGTPTYAFLYRTGGSPAAASVVRTRILDVTTDPNEVSDDSIPDYYPKGSCKLFAELDSFEPLPNGWALEHLSLASKPDAGLIAESSLQNQASPLYVNVVNGAPVGKLRPPSSFTAAALLDAIGSVRRSHQEAGPAPHKLLLLLVALAHIQSGQPRLLPFADYEDVLRRLLERHNPTGGAAPELPFWHLQSDGLWEVVDAQEEPVRDASGPLDAPPVRRLREDGVRGGFVNHVFQLLQRPETFLAAAQLALEMCAPDDESELARDAGLSLVSDDDVDYKSYALTQIHDALGVAAVREGQGQTYRLPNGARFYLRSMKRFPRTGGWYSYWFGLQEPHWVAGDFFVLQCGVSGTLVVPVKDWLPYQQRVPSAKEGTERQPQIWRQVRAFEFRVADESGRVPDEGRLDARRWLDRFDLMTGTESPVDPAATSVWWVNQGQSFARERDGGYVWAPTETKAGVTLGFHSNVRLLRRGDVVVHYANTKVRALGVVTAEAVAASNPAPGDSWGRDGFQAGVTYFALPSPIALEEVDTRRHLPSDGPFMASGGVKQGYLFRLADEFATYLRRTFNDRWPPDSPWAGNDAGRPELKEERVVSPEISIAGSFEDFTVELVQKFIADRRLTLDRNVIASAVAALRSGKHILLTGPPGTGKTELAMALAEAASSVDLSNGLLPTTATAEWTAIETIGGYSLGNDQQLVFRPGQVLEAIDRKSWLIIDEFNRADIDKAVGQLFSVLSGQPVTLPYVEVRLGVEAAPSIVPADVGAPAGTHAHHIDSRWRIIATLNTRDRDLLFSMSYALLRRFAVIDVPAPAVADFKAILLSKASTGDSDLDARLAMLIELPHRALGPAILIDCGQFIAARRRLDGAAEAASDVELLQDALYAFVVPQLDDLSRPQLSKVVAYLHSNVLKQGTLRKTAEFVSVALSVPVDDLMGQGSSGPTPALSAPFEEASSDVQSVEAD